MVIEVEIFNEYLQPLKMAGWKDGKYEVKINNLDYRSQAQNRAYWLYIGMIASTLNREGLYLPGLFTDKIEWDAEKVHYNIVHPLIKKVFGVKSTTKLKKADIDRMIDYLTAAFATKNVQLPPFPSIGTKEKE